MLGHLPAVKVICDMSTIEDLPKHVPQVIVGDLEVGFQVVEEHISTGGEITHVEGVASAEAKSRACA